jgi:hypothetical protein
MYRNFTVEQVSELRAAPETVFAAVSAETGGWMFLTKGVAAAGPDDPMAQVWEPGRQLTLRVERPDGWFNQLDYRLSPRPDGGTRLEYTHQGVFSEDTFDQMYAACQLHTPFYQHSLDEYSAHFAGRPITFVEPELPPGTTADDVLAALGVNTDAQVGATVGVHAPGLPAQDAVVDYRTEHFLGLRSDNALYRVFDRRAWGLPAGVTLHLFDPDVAADAIEQAWRDHLKG